MWPRRHAHEYRAMLVNAKQVFGFKHNMTYGKVYMDPKEQAAARHRLSGRAIKVIGVSETTTLQPFLQEKLECTVTDSIRCRPQHDDMSHPLTKEMLGENSH